MSNKEFKPETFYDFILSFEDGCNSGIEPLLLKKSQLAFGLNTSVRGAFVTHRPPIVKKSLVFSSPIIQHTFELALFQGAGYYRPDFGTESLLAHIGGHLFKLTESGTKWFVTDISVPNDYNDPNIGQVWMWQSEKWMIVNNGSALPIIYDGSTSRRSYGPSVVLGTTAAPFTPPVKGATVALTLAAPYTGPFNVPIILNKAYYQTMPNPSGANQVILTNVEGAVGATIPSGSQILVRPSLFGNTLSGSQTTFFPVPVSLTFPTGWECTFFLKAPELTAITLGMNLVIDGRQVTVVNIGPTNPSGIAFINSAVVSPLPSGSYSLIGPTLIQKTTSAPNFVVGVTSAPFVSPALGSDVTVNIVQDYTGANGQIVWIGNDEYSIRKPAPPGPSTTLTVLNMTDTTTAPVPNPVDLLSVPEIPAGRMGAYGLGRNWLSLVDGISFIGCDIVGGPSGTFANQNRDAVLKTTENTFLAGGGTFRLPGTGNTINAMWFTANLDQSLGQGPLQVGTAKSIFSCNTPVDRATWAAMTNPILTESLIGTGPKSQNSTALVNSDTFFRCNEGLASLVLARRGFTGWGNTPISQEMKRIIQKDNKSLLPYASSINFDNRFLSTASPNLSGTGVFSVGMIAMNLDTISNLRTKLPPCYDGVWTGINTLQVLTGEFGGNPRSFSFTFNVDTRKVELWELLQEETTETQDNGDTPIVWTFETPVLFNKDVKKLTQYSRLWNGEIYLKDIIGNVEVEIQYRPDFYPCWVSWKKFTVCADKEQKTVEDSQPGYRIPIGLGEPSVDPCEKGNNRPLRNGYFFQFRAVIKGSCKFMGMRVAAMSEPQPDFAPPICDPVCEE